MVHFLWGHKMGVLASLNLYYFKTPNKNKEKKGKQQDKPQV